MKPEDVMDKSILDMVHESAKDLHAAGVMKETTLREFDALTFQDAEKNGHLWVKRDKVVPVESRRSKWDLEKEG